MFLDYMAFESSSLSLVYYLEEYSATLGERYMDTQSRGDSVPIEHMFTFRKLQVISQRRINSMEQGNSQSISQNLRDSRYPHMELARYLTSFFNYNTEQIL